MLPTLSSQALTKILPPCVTCTNRMRPSSVQKQNHVLFFGQRMKRYGLTHTLPSRTGCGLCCFLRVPLLGKEGTVLARRTGWTQRLQTAAILNHSILWEASAHSPQAEVPSGAVWCQELWSEGLCARPLCTQHPVSRWNGILRYHLDSVLVFLEASVGFSCDKR